MKNICVPGGALKGARSRGPPPRSLTAARPRSRRLPKHLCAGSCLARARSLTSPGAPGFHRLMPPARLPYLNHERTRHGRMIWVVRVAKGPRTRMRAPYGSPEFMRDYRAAVEDPTINRRGRREPDEDTFAWLWNLYRRKSRMGSAIARDQKSARPRDAARPRAGRQPAA